MSRTFDPKALLAAVDAERRARGLSWEDLAQALHVSVSTMKNIDKRSVLETDGILQMTRWLGRPVDSFLPGGSGSPMQPAGDCRQNTGKFLRIDKRALHMALDAARAKRGLTWPEMAKEISRSGLVGTATLTSLAHGGRIDLYRALAITGWLGRPIEAFTQLTSR